MQESFQIYLRVLGPFAVSVEGQDQGRGTGGLRITTRKGRALLAYLAMHSEPWLSREHLAGLFWGDRSEANARHCLRQCILSLRYDLGAAAADVLLIEADRIGLNTQHVAVDAAVFKKLAESSVDSDLVRAADLNRGEFLSGFNLEEPFDAWVRKTRDVSMPAY
jgi:DNA-binding SARP family transcriptional activator